MKLSLQIESQFSSAVKKSWLRAAVKEALVAAKADPQVQLDLVIADDTTLHRLNSAYRNIDKPTDVLAFALTEASSWETPFLTPPGELTPLGEVVISYPTAAKQAEEHGHSIDRELAILVLHGVLHLLGYDHDTDEAEREMKALEERALSLLDARA